MKDLTLIIPAKEEAESLPVFLNELKQIDCKKLIVLQKDDLKTINVVKKMPNIEILEQINKGYGK